MLWTFTPRWYLLGISKLGSRGSVILRPKRLAGHSHWQNVRHTKEAKDKIKAANAQYYRFVVMSAIKAGGGIRDPKLNSLLADALARAKANSVPYSTLERAINAEDTTDPYVVEVQALGGLFILIESCAKSATSERQRLKSLVKRYGCSIPSTIGKITSEFFDHIGLISFKGGLGTSVIDLDSATNLGIDIGATEVEEITQDKEIIYQFHCDPADLEKLCNRLEDHKIPILSANDTYLPKNRVLVSPTVYENLKEMYEKIRQSHEHVDRIFDNVAVSEDK